MSYGEHEPSIDIICLVTLILVRFTCEHLITTLCNIHHLHLSLKRNYSSFEYS